VLADEDRLHRDSDSVQEGVDGGRARLGPLRQAIATAAAAVVVDELDDLWRAAFDRLDLFLPAL
jgi:hypothetical protein